MFVLDGKTLSLDTQFEHEGISYPNNWLRLSTQEERADLGITEIPDYPRPDDRFYWCSQNPDGTWTATPKDLDALKSAWESQTRQTAWTLLSPSDWLVTRKTENNTDIPVDWTTYREAVRAKAADTISAIEAAVDIEAFIAVVTNIEWPESPDAINI